MGSAKSSPEIVSTIGTILGIKLPLGLAKCQRKMTPFCLPNSTYWRNVLFLLMNYLK